MLIYINTIMINTDIYKINNRGQKRPIKQKTNINNFNTKMMVKNNTELQKQEIKNNLIIDQLQQETNILFNSLDIEKNKYLKLMAHNETTEVTKFNIRNSLIDIDVKKLIINNRIKYKVKKIQDDYALKKYKLIKKTDVLTDIKIYENKCIDTKFTENNKIAVIKLES